MTQLKHKTVAAESAKRRRSDRSTTSPPSDNDDTTDETKRSRRHHRRRRRGERCRKFRSIMYTIYSYCLIIFHATKDYLLELFFTWFWSGSQHACPPLEPQHDWLRRSPFELAAMIRRRELTAQQLFEACMRRMNQVNPLVNAIVDGPFADALGEAVAIDERIAAGQIDADEFVRKPLLGVPFTTKDSTMVRGRLHTLGLLSRKDTRGKDDAECVRLIREAGGILLATTSVPEVNKWQETRNRLIGQTNNPYDTRRTVGGSSGGEAAAITSCMSPFGLGSDIGGSIRMPAHFCGIYGHKPTVGALNTRGLTFRTGAEPSTMVVAGPMCRHADDLLPLMRLLCDADTARQLRLNDAPPDVRTLKYYYVRQSGELCCSRVASESQAAMSRVLAHLEELTGVQPEEVRLPCTEHTSRLWRYWMTQEPADFNKLLGNGRSLNGLVELAKYVFGCCEFTLASIYSLLQDMLPAENEARMKEYTRQCDEELTRLLGDDGILLYHSYTGPAPFHYVQLVNVYNFSYWSLFNVLHVPATQVPLGLAPDGRPLGLQVVATRNRDRDCLAVAEELGRAFGGWRAPFA